MKVLKVYAVKSLMEWHCEIVSGGVKFHFAFADGMTSSQGVTPARYKTTNPVFQSIIEHSHYFKSGKIILEKRVVLEADTLAVANETQPKAATPSIEKVEVSCLDDAKDYLNEKFNVDRRKLSSSNAIMECAKAHNIEFVGL